MINTKGMTGEVELFQGKWDELNQGTGWYAFTPASPLIITMVI
jgi:hypothetical protein